MISTNWPISKPAQKSTLDFLGLNQNPKIKQGEFTSTTNLSTVNFPCISPRPPRETTSTLTNPQALTVANNKLCYVAGQDFYYDSVKKNGAVQLTVGAKTMFVFGTKVIILPDKMYYDYSGSGEYGTLAPTCERTNEIRFINISKLFSDGSTVTFGTNTITITGTTWDNDFTAGTYITISGCIAKPANNGCYKIVTRTSNTVLTFAADTFTVDTEAATTAMTFAFSSMVTSGADFPAFKAGDYITVSNSSTLDNNKSAAIVGVDAKTLSFEPSTFMDSGSADVKAVTIEVDFPDLDYGVTHKNRIFGVKNDTIYASIYGSDNNFVQVGGPNDPAYAWRRDTQTSDNFTCIVKNGDQAITFKPEGMSEIYRDNNPFKLIDICKTGCIKNKAAIEINSVLYFLGRQGIYTYSGSFPNLISQNLTETYTDGVFGTDGRRLYACLYNGTKWQLFTFDTQLGLFLKEDDIQILDFANLNSIVYALDSTGKLLKFNSGTEVVTWEAILDIDTYATFNKKYISRITVRADLETGSTLSLYDKVDNGSFVLKKTSDTAGLNPFYAIMQPKRCDHYQIKLVGVGKCKVYAFGTELTLGSDY